MKNVFAYNTAVGELDGEKLALRKIDEDLSERQDRLIEKGEAQQEKASLPLWLQIVKLIMQFLMIVTIGGFLSGVIKALGNGKTFAEVLNNGWWILMVGGISAIVFLTLHFFEKKKVKTVVESEELEILENHSKGLHFEIMESLKVPQDAPQVDFFAHPYKLSRNGKKKNAGGMSAYVNLYLYAYREEDRLCIADMGTVYAVPLAGLKGIVKIEKTATFSSWNKEEPYNKGAYKKYKITVNNYGTLFVKPYYSLQFIADGEEFELLFPPYELETLEKLTGLTAEDNKSKGV